MSTIDNNALQHITFYSASAGSGKTYTLTHKIAELVAPDAEHRVDPSQLILTTFTVAAAADFKTRAREVLYEKGYYKEAQQLDMAQIGTIDSIAQDMVSRYWYLCKQSPTLNVIDDKGQKRYIRQSLSEMVSEEDVELYNKVFQQFRFTKSSGRKTEPNPDYWMTWLETMVSEMVTYGIESLENSQKESKRLLKEVLQTKSDKSLPAKKQMDTFINQLKLSIEGVKEDNRNAAKRRYHIQRCEKWLNYTSWNIAECMEVHKAIDFSVSSPDITKTYFNQMGDDDYVDFLDTTDMSSTADAYQLLCEAIDRTFDLVEKWNKEYKEFKRRHQLIDFTDMERLFLELLHRPEIETEMRGRYKVLMVDEFQDSNPLQVEIFLRLNELVEKSYWCGDPKQSIYGFRGSDYNLTTTVAELIAQNEENLETLGTSYRSVPSLVKFTNELFADKFTDSKSVTVTLDADRKKEDENAPTLLHWQAAAGNQDSFSKDLAYQIKAFATERKLDWKDIAVLGMDKYALKPIAKALDAIGVPVNYTTGVLNETREVALMQSLMALVSDPTNAQARAQVAFLTDPKYHLGEIIDQRLLWQQTENRDYEGWLAECEMVRTVGKLAPQIRLLGLPEQIEALYSQLGIRSVFERWGAAPQRESNMMALINAAREYEQRMRQFGEGASASDFFTTIDDVPAAGNIGGVSLATYFKSKGLEWPVVIMVSMDCEKATAGEVMKKQVFGITHRQTAAPSLGCVHPETLLTLLPSPFGASIPDSTKAVIQGTDHYKYIYEREQKEMMRLLYVGVTRARDCLIITGSQERNRPSKNFPNGSPKGQPLDKQTWLSSLDIDVESIMGHEGKLEWVDIQYIEADDQLKVNETEVGVFAPKWSDVERLSRFLSPSMSRDRVDVNLEQVATAAKPIEHNVADGRLMQTVGTCIHNIFAVGADSESAGRTIEAFGLAAQLPSPESVTASWQWLTGQLAKLHGAAASIGHEVPFEFVAGNGQTVRGEIDLVWETGGDNVVLVDFKTHLGKTDDGEGNDDLEQDIISRCYPAQLALYAEALRRAGKTVVAQYLYFPLGGEMVKVEFQPACPQSNP